MAQIRRTFFNLNPGGEYIADPRDQTALAQGQLALQRDQLMQQFRAQQQQQAMAQQQLQSQQLRAQQGQDQFLRELQFRRDQLAQQGQQSELDRALRERMASSSQAAQLQAAEADRAWKADQSRLGREHSVELMGAGQDFSAFMDEQKAAREAMRYQQSREDASAAQSAQLARWEQQDATRAQERFDDRNDASYRFERTLEERRRSDETNYKREQERMAAAERKEQARIEARKQERDAELRLQQSKAKYLKRRDDAKVESEARIEVDKAVSPILQRIKSTNTLGDADRILLENMVSRYSSSPPHMKVLQALLSDPSVSRALTYDAKYGGLIGGTVRSVLGDVFGALSSPSDLLRGGSSRVNVEKQRNDLLRLIQDQRFNQSSMRAKADAGRFDALFSPEVEIPRAMSAEPMIPQGSREAAVRALSASDPMAIPAPVGPSLGDLQRWQQDEAAKLAELDAAMGRFRQQDALSAALERAARADPGASLSVDGGQIVERPRVFAGGQSSPMFGDASRYAMDEALKNDEIQAALSRFDSANPELIAADELARAKRDFNANPTAANRARMDRALDALLSVGGGGIK